MTYEELEQIAIQLHIGEERKIYTSGDYTLSLLRPTKEYKNYDINRNLQIYLVEKDRKPYRPNHFRLLIDLYTRVREYPNSRNKLLEAFDRIFYGEDPLSLLPLLRDYPYSQALNPLDVELVLAQLFLVEQCVSYNGVSKYDPPSLYLQGWIRQFITENGEIDQVIAQISNRNTPKVGYTKCDDKNRIEFNAAPMPLWYLE